MKLNTVKVYMEEESRELKSQTEKKSRILTTRRPLVLGFSRILDIKCKYGRNSR